MRTSPVAAENIVAEKRTFFDFARYSSYIIQVRWKKSKTARFILIDLFKTLQGSVFSDMV